MRTTLELPDVLLREAKIVAAQEDTTLKELVTEGLQLILQRRHANSRPRMNQAPISVGAAIPSLTNQEIQQLFNAEEAVRLNEIYR